MRRLGKGLESLIQDIETPVTGNVSLVNIDYIKPNRFQPRKLFDSEKLNELAESIRENGLIQPLVVAKLNDTTYELIAGERRLLACKLIGIKEVHVYIKEVSDKEQLVLAIIENVQREDLTPIEEAKAYKRLIEEFGLLHEDVAKIMSKDRVTITNSLRLLKLSENIQTMIENKKLSSGHARAVLSVTEDKQEQFAEFIIEQQYNVRKAEEAAKDYENIVSVEKEPDTPSTVHQKSNKANFKLTEEELSKVIGHSVKIKEKNDSSCELTIKLKNKETLDELVEFLKESKILKNTIE